ncbi:MAG: hypothetical protein R2784_20465 [Saprospiraceae bacterium]
MRSTILSLIFALSLISCDKDDVIIPANNLNDPVVTFLTQNNGLVITKFIEDGEDETNYFRSFVFNFETDGTVIASGNGQNISGSYLIFKDDNRTELKMSFPVTNNFNELNDDWYFISQDANSITFDDDGDLLIFQTN